MVWGEVSRENIVSVAKSFPGVEHRIETVRTVEGVTYINDSKGTNVDASIRAVRAMKVPTVLLAGGYDKHTDFLPLAREILTSKIHTVVVLGDTAEQIERALRAVGFESILHAKTFEEPCSLRGPAPGRGRTCSSRPRAPRSGRGARSSSTTATSRNKGGTR